MELFALVAALLAATAVSEATAQACHRACTCQEDYYMICDDAGLARPPEGYWPQVSLLWLQDNDIAELYEYSFSGFPEAMHIMLTNNKLTSFDVLPFASLPLRSIGFSGNYISSINAPDNLQLSNLTDLFISNNRLTELGPDLLARVAPNLKNLILGNNPLKTESGTPLFNHSNVQILLLDGVDASDLNAETFAALPALQWLSLNDAQVRDIGGAFVDRPTVSLFLLSGNNITEVTVGTFASVRGVESLYLRGNPLQRLDVDAVRVALAGGEESVLSVDDTPLACGCDYDELYWWAQESGVTLEANCQGAPACLFTRRAD